MVAPQLAGHCSSARLIVQRQHARQESCTFNNLRHYYDVCSCLYGATFANMNELCTLFNGYASVFVVGSWINATPEEHVAESEMCLTGRYDVNNGANNYFQNDRHHWQDVWNNPNNRGKCSHI